jgi:hypothetical protein
MTMKLFALLAAVAVYSLWAARAAIWAMIRNPSPDDEEERGSWVKRLFGMGSDPSDDPDEDEAGEEPYTRGYDLVDDDQQAGHVRVEWLNTPRPKRPDESKSRDEEIVDHWARLQNQGWKYGERLDDTMRAFRVSESTVKRALKRARNED